VLKLCIMWGLWQRVDIIDLIGVKPGGEFVVIDAILVKEVSTVLH